jgi:RNA polymerase sigma-70 factor (ECF subfamily)
VLVTESTSFDDLLERLNQGQGEAAEEIFERYASRLVALARGRLDAGARRKVDPEDVLQSVFRSFFARYEDGRFDLQDWDGLWALLVVLTLRKCGRKVEYLRAAMRDCRREFEPRPSDGESSAAWEALAREPTPDEVVSLTELTEQLMQGLDPKRREMVSLRLQGYTVAEISQQVGLSERAVFRGLALAKENLERWCDKEP